MDTLAEQPRGEKPTEEGRAEFKVIGLIGVAHFFSHFYIYLIPPLFPLLKETLGVS